MLDARDWEGVCYFYLLPFAFYFLILFFLSTDYRGRMAPSGARPSTGPEHRSRGDRLKSHLLIARHYRGAAKLRKHSTPQG